MKKLFKVLIFLFVAILLLASCGITDPQDGKVNEFYEDSVQEPTETGIGMSDSSTDMDSVPKEIDMSNVISNTGLDLENRYIMTDKEADIRDRPRQSGYVLRTLSYQMVNVGAAAYGDDGIWVLVSFTCSGESFDNMGWVKLTDLMEYTEENYQLLRYPVKVKEGCVDIETGEPVEWEAFRVDYVDDYAHVVREGGRSYNVSPSDIIYPEFYNNSPYNFPTFSDY